MDPSVQLDEEVEDVLINIAECFVESIAEGSCRVAKHRQMNSIAVSDVQLYLGKFIFYCNYSPFESCKCYSLLADQYCTSATVKRIKIMCKSVSDYKFVF